MNAHGRPGGQQTTALTEEFIDGYAIIGRPDHCVARLRELAELGIDKFLVMGPNFAAPSAEAQAAAMRGHGGGAAAVAGVEASGTCVRDDGETAPIPPAISGPVDGLARKRLG